MRWPRRQAAVIAAAFFSFFFGYGYWYAGFGYALDSATFATIGLLALWIFCRIAIAYLEWPARNPLIRWAKRGLLWLLIEDEHGVVE